MRMTTEIDRYVAEQWADGRFASPATEQSYRYTLSAHAEDCANRDPRFTDRDDVIRTLARWQHPNSRRLKRAHLISFYSWLMENGERKDNPARQTRRPRKRPTRVKRLTLNEVMALSDAVRTNRERRLVDLGLFAGLRASELTGMQGRHFRRPGFVWVSPDIGKGGKERYVPVCEQLGSTWWEIAQKVGDDEYVLQAVVEGQYSRARKRLPDPSRPMSYRALHQLVGRLGARAGVSHPVHPHLLRHAFGERVANYCGDIRIAQAVLGHDDLSATQIYTGKPSLDQLAEAFRGFGYRAEGASVPLAAVYTQESAGSALSGVLRALWLNQGLRRVAREMAGVS